MNQSYPKAKPLLPRALKVQTDAAKLRKANKYAYHFDWPQIESLDTHTAERLDRVFTKSAQLLSNTSRLSDNEPHNPDIQLVHDLMMRATTALRSTLYLIHAHIEQDAWLTLRLIIESCVYIKYFLQKKQATHFNRHNILKVLQWSYTAKSLGIIPGDEVEDFRQPIEQAEGPNWEESIRDWSPPQMKTMCIKAFGKVPGKLIYSDYQWASLHLHPVIPTIETYFAKATNDLKEQDTANIFINKALLPIEALLPFLKEHSFTFTKNEPTRNIDPHLP